MIEKILEGKLINKVQSLITDCEVIGFWTPADEGTAKEIESPHIINIVCGTREVETESLKPIKINMTLEIKTQLGKDPRGLVIGSYGATIIDWLYSLNGNYSDLKSDTYSDDTYSITGCKMEIGDNGFDQDSKTWFVVCPVTFFIVPA